MPAHGSVTVSPSVVSAAHLRAAAAFSVAMDPAASAAAAPPAASALALSSGVGPVVVHPVGEDPLEVERGNQEAVAVVAIRERLCRHWRRLSQFVRPRKLLCFAAGASMRSASVCEQVGGAFTGTLRSRSNTQK